MLITSEKIAKIKDLHSVNCAPYVISCGKEQKYINEVFGYIKPPYSRLHDCQGSYGGTYFVDVPNIFRNFDADENDENNYDFYYSDEYIGAIIKAGTKIVYRLGVTIEWGSKKYTCNPPKDFAKWARICEHIIMHYNKGWANGFNYGIEYWEIWNEPENPPMWTGTKEQFLELYKVSSKYLKEKFPEIKIGGYGSCGFYATFNPDANDFYKSFVIWFEDFLKMCKEENCPLDFYSWHIYTPRVHEIRLSAKYVKEKLIEYGFVNTESHLNEWNYGAEGGGFDNMDTMIGAGFIATALISMQKDKNIDLAQYYCLSPNGTYNGTWNLRTKEYSPVMHVLWAFNRLYSFGQMAKTENSAKEPDILAAISEDGNIRVLLSNYKKLGRTSNLDLEGFVDKPIKIYSLESGAGFKFIKEIRNGEPFYFESGVIYYLEN